MNSTLEYKGYITDIKYSAQDQCLYGKIEHIKDLILFEAQNPTEIIDAFQKAVDEYLEECAEDGVEAEVTCKGTFNVRIGSDLHRAAAYEALRQDISLNDFVKTAIQDAVCREKPTVLTHKHEHTVTVIQKTESIDVNYSVNVDQFDEMNNESQYQFAQRH